MFIRTASLAVAVVRVSLGPRPPPVLKNGGGLEPRLGEGHILLREDKAEVPAN